MVKVESGFSGFPN